MSANNGIYIAKFLDGYRVIEASSITNLWYYKSGTPEYLDEFYSYFGKADPFDCWNDAFDYASKLNFECKTEYGIINLGEYDFIPQRNIGNSLILIRGLPGSGKTTLAKQLCVDDCSHFEADQYFINNGEYVFDKTKLSEAHAWCLAQTELNIALGGTVIVSNTFTTKKELLPYFRAAKILEVPVTVILCQGNFKSIHGVPEETMERMRSRFEYDISELYNLKGEHNDTKDISTQETIEND